MSTRVGWDSPPRLEARALSFGYTPQEPLLQEWDAAFEAGSMTAITGPSGRGKSTLMYLLGLMLRPSYGGLLLDGVDVVDRKDSELARLRAGRFGGSSRTRV